VSSEAFVRLAADMDSLVKRMEALDEHLARVRERRVVLDDDLWYWAQYRAKSLGKESVSQYVFDLIREDKEKAK
jgi:hypothetical protein